MTVTRFEPGRDLLYVRARVFGRLGYRDVRLAFDTGASVTSLVPDVTTALGYSVRDSLRRTRAPFAGGVQRGYLVEVHRFEALGFGFEAFCVNVLDLGVPGVDGLLGLNFLHAFNYEIRSIEGRILAERAA